MFNLTYLKPLKSLALLSLCCCTSSAALAFGTPTYTVYFDGGGANAGTIVINGAAFPMPEGACGMRILDAHVMAYYWADYNGFGLGPMMPAPFAGPPNSDSHPPGMDYEPFIEFTGPYGDNCGNEVVFNSPLTGEYPTFANGTPQGGGALVFQVLPGNFANPANVEWLTESFTPWQAPPIDPLPTPNPNPVPEIPHCSLALHSEHSHCTIGDLVFEFPCTADYCASGFNLGKSLLKAKNTVEKEIVSLRFAYTGDRKDVQQQALNETVIAIGKIKQGLASLDKQYRIALSELSLLRPTPEIQQQMDTLTQGQSISRLTISSCLQALEKVQAGARLTEKTIAQCQAYESVVWQGFKAAMSLVPATSVSKTSTLKTAP